MNIKFSYYYGKEADQYSFFKIPKILYTDSIFKTLSSDAKVLYAILLDRMSLSMKNGWLDEENKVFIIFTIDEIEETMNIGRNKAINIMKEIQDFGLIEKKRRGLGKPNIIYVKSFLVETKEENRTAEEETSEDRSLNVKFQEVSKANLQKFEKQTSRNLENKLQEVSKTNCNNTEYNYTEFSENESYQYLSEQEKGRDRIQERNEYRQLIHDNIEYEILCQSYGTGRVEELVELMLDAICSTKTYQQINGEAVPTQVVKSRLLKVGYEHIQYVFFSLDRSTSKVKNIRQYMLTVLYNAPATINQFYDAEVRHDMYWGKDIPDR